MYDIKMYDIAINLIDGNVIHFMSYIFHYISLYIIKMYDIAINLIDGNVIHFHVIHFSLDQFIYHQNV